MACERGIEISFAVIETVEKIAPDSRSSVYAIFNYPIAITQFVS
jgi:hypothetical protein